MLPSASGKSKGKKLTSQNATIIEDDEDKNVTTHNPGVNMPDLCKSDPNSSYESQEPDIVRSSSSSSDNDKADALKFSERRQSSLCTSSPTSSNSSEIQCRPVEKTSTVSSFSSSDESTHSTYRYFHDSNRRLKPLVSQSSGENEVFEPTPTTTLANDGDKLIHPKGPTHALSERGQRVRSEFCSSGYGTGSGENSTSKRSGHLSEDLDNELKLPMSEKCENLQDSTGNTDTIGSTLLAIDIKSISNKVKESNNVSMNSTKASNGCSDQISQSSLETTSKASFLPSDNVKSFMGAHVFMDFAYTGTISSSRASLSDPLRKPYSNLTNCSSSNSDSYFITPSTEAALPVHSNLPSSLLHQMCCTSETGSQPYESQKIESLVFSGKKFESTADSYSYAKDPVLLDKLERSARCEEIQCDDQSCCEIQSCINELRNYNLDPLSLSSHQRNLLLQMIFHYERCELPRCPFSWCGTTTIDGSNREEKIMSMLKRVENFTDNQLLFGSSIPECIKRGCQNSDSEMPEEKVHWQRLCMVENSSKVLLARVITPKSTETSYWIIKKVHYNEEDRSLWDICCKLRQMNCAHVVKLLWAAKFEEHLLICSEYEGYHSLHESLQANSSKGLDIGLVHTIMLQLTEATHHLHLQNIIYLNWTSSNIIRTHQTDQRIAVKLCNFTTSALADTENVDYGYLRLALPTHLLPPELCMKNRIVPESDNWGLACIMYELLTGHPIWHEQRHLSSEDLLAMMKDGFLTAIPGEKQNGINLADMCPGLKSIFKICWEIEPEKRQSVLEIQIMLVESFLQTNQNIPTT